MITGVTQGSIGGEVALQLSQFGPSLLILAGRNASKLQATQQALRFASPSTTTRLLILDLSSQAQIRTAASEVNSYAEPCVDRLINNAAIMAAPYSTTEDGLESQFGTNHIGHFLFTNLIMPKLLAAGSQARIVNVSSSGHRREQIRFEDYNFSNGATYDKWRAYGQSKTANMLFTIALAEKLGPMGMLSYSLYPGRVRTNIAQNLTAEEMRKAGWIDDHGNIVPNPALSWKTLAEGAATTIAAAFDPSIAGKPIPLPLLVVIWRWF